IHFTTTFFHCCSLFPFFFFHDTSTSEIYTLSLHDALPIYQSFAHLIMEANKTGSLEDVSLRPDLIITQPKAGTPMRSVMAAPLRSEEHTSELQSPYDLVCRLLLEKKKKTE